MRNAKLLIWLTQLGLSTVAPLAGFVLLAVWLQRRFDWGPWVIVAGVILGIICAVDGLITSLKAMERMTPREEKDPPVGFNSHE